MKRWLSADNWRRHSAEKIITARKQRLDEIGFVWETKAPVARVEANADKAETRRASVGLWNSSLRT